VEVTPADLARLETDEFLNDTIIDFYMRCSHLSAFSSALIARQVLPFLLLVTLLDRIQCWPVCAGASRSTDQCLNNNYVLADMGERRRVLFCGSCRADT
jgi:hypothetical protein